MLTNRTACGIRASLIFKFSNIFSWSRGDALSKFRLCLLHSDAKETLSVSYCLHSRRKCDTVSILMQKGQLKVKGTGEGWDCWAALWAWAPWADLKPADARHLTWLNYSWLCVLDKTGGDILGLPGTRLSQVPEEGGSLARGVLPTIVEDLTPSPPPIHRWLYIGPKLTSKERGTDKGSSQAWGAEVPAFPKSWSIYDQAAVSCNGNQCATSRGPKTLEWHCEAYMIYEKACGTGSWPQTVKWRAIRDTRSPSKTHRMFQLPSIYQDWLVRGS